MLRNPNIYIYTYIFIYSYILISSLSLNTVEVEIFALKKVCDFSNLANIEFFANGNYLRFFIPFESLKGKGEKIAKVYFCDHTTSQKKHLKSRRKNFYFYSILYSYSGKYIHQMMR